MDSEIITTYSDNSEKCHFKMEWCRKAGFSPYDDLYWELAERSYAQRHFDCSPVSVSRILAVTQNKGNR